MTIDELEAIIEQAKKQKPHVDMAVYISNQRGEWFNIDDAVVAPDGQLILIQGDD